MSIAELRARVRAARRRTRAWRRIVAKRLRRLKEAVLRRRKRRERGPTAMFDSVDVSQLPADAAAVAGYTAGSWPTYPTLLKSFPHAHVLSIAIGSGYDADCLDVEPGDATPAVAAAWVKRQLLRGVKRPVVYTSVSGMDSLLATLAAAGIKRSQVRVWTAHYTFSAHLCGPRSCGQLRSTTADATQWTDKALGRNLDESLLAPGFFA
jgi:hypothetical protein